MITRRKLLAGAPAILSAQKRTPNVLFFAVDDLNTRLGCYGSVVRSPHIDGLARNGVRFDRAYCQYPLCNPSRSSLLTGRRPPTTKVFGNQTWFRDTMPEVVTLPQHFRNNGYWTACTGKIFHGGLDDDKGWAVGATPLRRAVPQDPKSRQANADRWEATAGEGEDLVDYKTASRAIALLEKRPADQPFFLACGFLKPHVPLVAPKKYFDLYDPAKLALPEDFAPMPAGQAPVYRPNFDLFIQREAPPELSRQALQAYYACVSFTDAQVGRVLEALRRAGLAGNTIVSLFGDHGWHLGEKGQWSKMSLFEISTRAPLIISAPGHARNKTVLPPVEFVDIYPTLSDLCGLPAPAGVEGTSLKPLLKNPGARWDRPAFTFVRRGESSNGGTIRTADFRFTEWRTSAGTIEELYDHRRDPHELKNLSASAAHDAEKTRLRAELRRVWPAS